MKKATSLYIPRDQWLAQKQGKAESMAKWGGDVAISKLLKAEIEQQITFCETYMSLYKQFHSGNGFQPSYLTKTFGDNIPEMIQVRLDSLQMAMKLKHHTYEKVAAGGKRVRYEMEQLAKEIISKDTANSTDCTADVRSDLHVDGLLSEEEEKDLC